MVIPPSPEDPFVLRRGGILSGLLEDRLDPSGSGMDQAIYVATDTGEVYQVHFEVWTLLPITWQAEDDDARDALTNLNEGDWCYVMDTHRYSFWDGTIWRQVRY